MQPLPSLLMPAKRSTTYAAMAVLSCFLFLTPTMAKADFLNGHELKIYCSSQDPNDDAICIVYITGAFDAFTTVDLIGEKTSGAERLFCADENTQPTDLKVMMMDWMNRPETNLDYAATLLVWGAMRENYGCAG